MKFLRALCILALALCVTASVYAETQSVKVSGDLTMRGIFRNDYDYRGSFEENDAVVANTIGDQGSESNQTWAMTAAEIEVDADLTDNVQTVIRLVNQRDWNVTHNKNLVGANYNVAWNGHGGYTDKTDEFAINVDLAYVTLKDFIYSPLTVTIGRQDLWFGKGFIVGANQQAPGINVANSPAAVMGNGQNNWALSAPEYTVINSFDAIKAVLDYDPWTITGVYANIQSGLINSNDGVNLYGINVGYKFDSYKAEAEAYWFWKQDRQIQTWSGIKSSNEVHSLGMRGSFDPIDVITIFGEGAFQLGEYVGTPGQINNRDRAGYALDFGAECRYFTEKFSWQPKVGVEYVLYSGSMPESNENTAAGTFTGWDPMYRGKFDSAIREFVGKFYQSYDYQARPNFYYSCPDASYTNQQQLIVSGSIQPVESLTLKGNYNVFWTMKDYLAQAPGGTLQSIQNWTVGGFVGQEVDLQAIWDYTEDVSFGLLTAWFFPGEVYYNADKTATDIVATVKVDF